MKGVYWEQPPQLRHVSCSFFWKEEDQVPQKDHINVLCANVPNMLWRRYFVPCRFMLFQKKKKRAINYLSFQEINETFLTKEKKKTIRSEPMKWKACNRLRNQWGTNGRHQHGQRAHEGVQWKILRGISFGAHPNTTTWRHFKKKALRKALVVEFPETGAGHCCTIPLCSV